MYLDAKLRKALRQQSSSPTQGDVQDKAVSHDEAVEIALRSEWLSKKDGRIKSLLSSKMEMITLKKNRSLSKTDDGSLFCVIKGLAVMTYQHFNAGLVIQAVLRPQRWFGEHSALGQRSLMMKVTARQACQLAVIRQGDIRELLECEPDLGWVFFSLNALNVSEHLVNAVDLLIIDPHLRICSRLLTFAGRTPSYFPSSPVVIPLTQGEIARSANVSRSTAFNVLGELAQKAICEVGYR
jgi:CRP-like cAMP-binding protein